MKNLLITKKFVMTIFILLLAGGIAFSQAETEEQAEAENVIENIITEGAEWETDAEELAEINDVDIADVDIDDVDIADMEDGERTEEEIVLTEEKPIAPVPILRPLLTEEEQAVGSPLWVRDLRRGEIVAFGALPFTVFFTRMFMNVYRSAINDWDSRYSPSPLTGSGTVPMTEDELKAMYSIAASAAVVVAVADHFIIRHKRSKARKAR